jgi:hypothetical protein
MERTTIYEPHPVSPERKAELLENGFKIIDARFAPAEEAPAEEAPAEEAKPVANAAKTGDNVNKSKPRKVEA